MKTQNGFTLVELMIVIAIIGIIASIAVPAFTNYTSESADTSCLQEVKHYANQAYIQLVTGQTVSAPSYSACASISRPLNLNSGITAMPVAPGLNPVVCDLTNGVQCS